MIVRPAAAADVEAIRRLVGDAFRPYVARIGREPAPMAAGASPMNGPGP